VAYGDLRHWAPRIIGRPTLQARRACSEVHRPGSAVVAVRIEYFLIQKRADLDP